MTEKLTIAMWSGPRNLSTALMRSFGNRRDVVQVLDEPFYAAYLAATGKAHPMHEEVLASQPNDWRVVAADCLATPEHGISYQKHMAQHMLPGFGWDWSRGLCNCFLIRSPEAVASSFLQGWPDAESEDLGFAQQAELFDRICQSQGAAPPVVDARDIRLDPEGVLRALCAAIGIPWDAGMLRWPSGPRDSDGIWARHWYASVEASTTFAPPESEPPPPQGRAARLAAAARPHYEKLHAHRVQPATAREN